MNPRTKLRSPSIFSPTSPPPPLASSSYAIDDDDKLVHKMHRKAMLKPTLTLAFLFFLSLFAVYYTFFNSFTPNLNNKSTSFLSAGVNFHDSTAKVKIFMYDLPRKFTYGVIERYEEARGKKDTKKDDALFKYPGHQHSAEWHLFRDLNRPSHERVDSPVTRVYNPEEADFFYVPFFSSLSLVVNINRPASLEVSNYSDEEMQESFMEWLEEQLYWKRNNGRDHIFICQDPNALYKVVDRVKNGILLVSDFGRLTHDQGSLVKDVILPYSHRINSYMGDVGIENRDKLLFFMGNRYRKEGGKVRDMLFQILENEKGVIIKHGAQSRESRREATKGMHTSKFCLHPAGDTPSACRLFDAIVSLCIPVIVSDSIELPFEDVIDYRKIAIFVDTNSAVKPGYLVKFLRRVSKEKILEFQREVKEVKHYFEYEDSNGTVKEIWRQVSKKLPLVKLMINRDKRLVKRELTEPDCSCICSNQTGRHTSL